MTRNRRQNWKSAIMAIVAGVSLVASGATITSGGTMVTSHVTTLSQAGADVGMSQPGRYQIGSGNTATADPLVPRPKTKPCQVLLFMNDEFDNYNQMPFNYTPPADCPGPWAKVVFNANFNVTEGIQYDRTGNVWIAGSVIYFGTTPEPSPTLGPNWHVESDLTDYSSLFAMAQTGQVTLGNTVNGQYTGIIYGTAWLQFYPLEPNQKAPVTADMVLPLSGSSTGGTVALNAGTDLLSQTFTLPTNVESAYLDVFAQGQSDDEFWYTCVPDDVASELESCTGTAFREAEVTIDGTPAGVAPIYPWIFTGGIDPYLWIPTPGVQTLNFVAYRVNLTPFAGVLSNGQQHTVALSVFNADSYFSATANLLLYLDHGSQTVTGAVTTNTLTVPNPNVVENLQNNNGTITGTVTVTNGHRFAISGYAVTSKGTLTTTVEQNVQFKSLQTFDIVPNTTYVQDIDQDSYVNSNATTSGGGTHVVSAEQFNYPLKLGLNVAYDSNGNGVQTANIEQVYKSNTFGVANNVPQNNSVVTNTVTTTDELDFNVLGQITGNQDQASSQHFIETNTIGPLSCYDRLIASANNLLASVTNGCAAK